MGVDGFSFLRGRVIEVLNPAWIDSLTHAMWEERILPALFELEKKQPFFRAQFVLSRYTFGYCGNDLQMAARFFESESQATYPVHGGFLYGLSGIEDISILRRLKDYPDETDRSELLVPWVAECVEVRSILVVNAFS